MVIKISLGKKNEKDNFLGRFKVELPNGYQVFLMTHGDPLVYEKREDKLNRFITDLEGYLGEYSYLKEEIIKIFTNLQYEIEIPKYMILIHIKMGISNKLKRKGEKRRERKKIRSKLFDILLQKGYILRVHSSFEPIYELFTIGHSVRRFIYNSEE